MNPDELDKPISDGFMLGRIGTEVITCEYCRRVFYMNGSGPKNLDWHNCTEKLLSKLIKRMNAAEKEIEKLKAELERE